MTMGTAFKRIWYGCQLGALGYPTGDPTASSDPNAVIICEAMRRAAEKIISAFAWRALTQDVTFTTVATAKQDNSNVLFTKVDRFVMGSCWNDSGRRPIVGPVSDKDWRVLTKRVVPVGVDVYLYFKREGINWYAYVHPIPAAGLTYSFSYITKYWVTYDSGGGVYVDAADFSAQTDISLIDEDLLVKAAIPEALKSFGQDAEDAKETYFEALSSAKAKDGGSRVRRLGYSDNDEEPCFGINTGDNVVTP